MPSTSSGHPRLVGDIGGTHARFASVVAPGAPLSHITVHDCDDYDGIEPLLRHRLDLTVIRPVACALGIATPVTGDDVRMTNRPWSFSISAVQTNLGFERLRILNDFAALALGLPTIGAQERTPVGRGQARPFGNMLAIGPGTGLGVAGLIHAAGRWRPIAGEGGHVSLAAESDVEMRLMVALRAKFGHVSAERVLSGPGLVHLYEAVCALRGRAPRPLAPADITRHALDLTDQECSETLDLFLGWLGAVAGDMALAFGALGGVFVGGGIVSSMPTALAASTFRARFEAKGRYQAYLAAVPTWIVADASEAALRGADLALDSEE